MHKVNLVSFILFVNTFTWAVKLVAQPNMIIKQEVIEVAWHNVTHPKNSDIIAIFAPINSSWELFWKQASDSPTWSEGFGNFAFTLLNIRQDYVFRYFSFNNSERVMVAESNIVLVKKTEPMQAHLSLTSNCDEMVLMWHSAFQAVPQVKIGFSSGWYDRTFTGNSTTYTQEKSGKYFWDPGWIHKVILTALTPGTKYYYRFGTSDAWSDEQFFFVPRNDTEISFIALGDSGVSNCLNYGAKIPKEAWCTPHAQRTYSEIENQVLKSPFDFTIHLGDSSYANGFEIRWDQFFLSVEQFASKVSMLPVPGNHDISLQNPYLHRFHSPENGVLNFYYSKNFQSLHITIINTEDQSDEQIKWLERDLQSVDHEKQWLIVFQHIPMYTSTGYDVLQKQSAALHARLERLYVANRVDVVISGHVHQYERTCPVVNYTCVGNESNPGGPIHIIAGNGGMWTEQVWKNISNWSVYRSTRYGYLKIAIPHRGQLNIQFIDSINSGEILDTVMLHNPMYYSTNATKHHTLPKKYFVAPQSQWMMWLVMSVVVVLLLLRGRWPKILATIFAKCKR